MSLKPCMKCGEPTENTRCPEHTPTTKNVKDHTLSAQRRGYTESWNKLSRRARRLQPFCSDCGATERLSADHSPEAWQRHEQGLPIRLEDVEVVCLACNNRRGPARGDGVRRRLPDRGVKPQTRLVFGMSPEKGVS